MIDVPPRVPRSRRRGRPRDTSEATRARHLECARLRLVMGWTLQRCGAALGVTTSTAHRWVQQALDYPEADALRRLAGLGQEDVA